MDRISKGHVCEAIIKKLDKATALTPEVKDAISEAIVAGIEEYIGQTLKAPRAKPTGLKGFF